MTTTQGRNVWVLMSGAERILMDSPDRLAHRLVKNAAGAKRVRQTDRAHGHLTRCA